MSAGWSNPSATSSARRFTPSVVAAVTVPLDQTVAPAVPPAFSAALVCAVGTTVTESTAERALSSRDPSLTNDANCSAWGPAESVGSRALHSNIALVSEFPHETPASSDRAPST